MRESTPNQKALADGYTHRIEIFAANMARSDPEFANSRAAAFRRRKALLSAGYRATVFEITQTALIQRSS